MATPLRIPDVRSLKQFIDRPVGPSEWVTITKKKIELFAEATGDHQWIHVDEERARLESPFGRPVAHGFLTLSLAPMLLTELLAVDGVALTINYGIDKQNPAADPGARRVAGPDVRIHPLGARGSGWRRPRDLPHDHRARRRHAPGLRGRRRPRLRPPQARGVDPQARLTGPGSPPILVS
jgi:hypothetical protein